MNVALCACVSTHECFHAVPMQLFISGIDPGFKVLFWLLVYHGFPPHKLYNIAPVLSAPPPPAHNETRGSHTGWELFVIQYYMFTALVYLSPIHLLIHLYLKGGFNMPWIYDIGVLLHSYRYIIWFPCVWLLCPSIQEVKQIEKHYVWGDRKVINLFWHIQTCKLSLDSIINVLWIGMCEPALKGALLLQYIIFLWSLF